MSKLEIAYAHGALPEFERLWDLCCDSIPDRLEDSRFWKMRLLLHVNAGRLRSAFYVMVDLLNGDIPHPFLKQSQSASLTIIRKSYANKAPLRIDIDIVLDAFTAFLGRGLFGKAAKLLHMFRVCPDVLPPSVKDLERHYSSIRDAVRNAEHVKWLYRWSTVLSEKGLQLPIATYRSLLRAAFDVWPASRPRYSCRVIVSAYVAPLHEMRFGRLVHNLHDAGEQPAAGFISNNVNEISENSHNPVVLTTKASPTTIQEAFTFYFELIQFLYSKPSRNNRILLQELRRVIIIADHFHHRAKSLSNLEDLGQSKYLHRLYDMVARRIWKSPYSVQLGALATDFMGLDLASEQDMEDAEGKGRPLWTASAAASTAPVHFTASYMGPKFVLSQLPDGTSRRHRDLVLSTKFPGIGVDWTSYLGNFRDNSALHDRIRAIGEKLHKDAKSGLEMSAGTAIAPMLGPRWLLAEAQESAEGIVRWIPYLRRDELVNDTHVETVAEEVSDLWTIPSPVQSDSVPRPRGQTIKSPSDNRESKELAPMTALQDDISPVQQQAGPSIKKTIPRRKIMRKLIVRTPDYKV